jgi:cytochrome c-type biogenesis protein CcmF
VFAGIVSEWAAGVRRHRTSNPACGRARAAFEIIGRSRRRYGAYIAHAGIGLAVIAISASSAFDTKVQATLNRGESVTVGNYTLTYRDMSRERADGAMKTRATFTVATNGSPSGSIKAGRNFYPAVGEASNEVGIRHRFITGEDLFVTVDSLDERGVVRATVIVNPLVNLLWFSGLLICAGGIVAAYPARQRNANGSGIDVVIGDVAIPANRAVREAPSRVNA